MSVGRPLESIESIVRGDRAVTAAAPLAAVLVAAAAWMISAPERAPS